MRTDVNVGDILVCERPASVSLYRDEVTVGKRYMIVMIDGPIVVIINDFGELCDFKNGSLMSQRFDTLKDLRSKKN